MADPVPKIDKIVVEENGRKMTIAIPRSGDSSYDSYLREAEIEKTREQLRKRGPKPEAKPGSVENLAGLMRERAEYNRRKLEGPNKKYF